jgi:hypothetical protein
MKLLPRVALLGLSSLVVFLVACHRWDDQRFPEVDSGTPSPGLTAFAIFTGGGDSDGQAGQNAGDGGDITINATAGRVTLNDGRNVPNPVSNFLTVAVMESGDEVTFSELVSLQAPVLAGGVATFTLTGQGFWLLNNITLDLSDAPFTGVTPATDVSGVSIVSDEAIRIDGDIFTTRVGNDAVDISFSSSHADGVVVRGTTDARGREGFDGGDVGFDAGAAALLALGPIWTNAGDATSVLGAGQGGDVSLNAGLGDLLLRSGSLGTYGGLGQQDGGDGGDVIVDFSDAGNASYNWGIGTQGGMGRDGDGGDGGFIALGAGSDTNWFARFDTRGGNADTGVGGIAGDIAVSGYSHTGTIETDTSGGNTSTGTGGDAGDALITGGQIDGLLLDARASGGRGDVGGQAGTVGLDSFGIVSGSQVMASARGGNGITQGGNGGQAVILASVNIVTIQDSTVYGDVTGGSASGGLGGFGGDVLVIENGAPVTNIQNTVLSGFTDGGNGETGGDAGDFAAVSSLGLVDVSITGNAGGGDSTLGVGGAGGDVVAISDNGAVNAWIQATANGGSAEGAVGGAGGTLVIVSSNIGSAGGSASGAGSFTANGGSSDTTGGAGGILSLDAGDTGNCTLSQMQIDLHGGAGDTTGGVGGQVNSSVVGTLHIDGGTIDLAGGSSSAGTGGDGGLFELFTDNGSVIVEGALTANGGSGPTSGGDGGSVEIITDSDTTGDAGDVVVDGSITVNGGSSTGGAGGLGGAVEVFASSGGVSGSVIVDGNITARGGTGAGGDGGLVYLTTDGFGIAVTGSINVNGAGASGDGGTVVLGDDTDGNPGLLTIGASAQIRANGAGTGVAGFIELNPAGAGPNNPNLVESISALIQTNDGDGTDQSATNVTRD